MIVFRPRWKFAFFSHCRVQTPCCALVQRYFLAIVAIFVCSSVEFFFPFHVEAKLLGNSFNSRNGLFESSIIVPAPSLSARIEPFQFSENLTPESGRSLDKIFDFSFFGVPAFGEVVIKDSDHYSANYRPERKTSKFDWHSFILGVYGSLLASASCLITQRFLSRFT